MNKVGELFFKLLEKRLIKLGYHPKEVIWVRAYNDKPDIEIMMKDGEFIKITEFELLEE